MRILGFVLMAVGAVMALIAFGMDTTVDSTDAGGILPSRTHNLGLLQTQMMVLQTGLAMLIAGAVFARPSAQGATVLESSSPVAHTPSPPVVVAKAQPAPSIEAPAPAAASSEPADDWWSSPTAALVLFGGGGVLLFIVIVVASGV